MVKRDKDMHWINYIVHVQLQALRWVLNHNLFNSHPAMFNIGKTFLAEWPKSGKIQKYKIEQDNCCIIYSSGKHECVIFYGNSTCIYM